MNASGKESVSGGPEHWAPPSSTSSSRSRGYKRISLQATSNNTCNNNATDGGENGDENGEVEMETFGEEEKVENFEQQTPSIIIIKEEDETSNFEETKLETRREASVWTRIAFKMSIGVLTLIDVLIFGFSAFVGYMIGNTKMLVICLVIASVSVVLCLISLASNFFRFDLGLTLVCSLCK
jgi:hypothetical protein